MTPDFSRIYIVIALLLGCFVTQTHAQSASDIPNRTWEVYLERDIAPDGLDRLVFLDVLTGETTSAEIYGERYTPTIRGVIFFDYVTNRVMLARMAGDVIPHPFIQLDDGAHRVDWVVAADGRSIAWTLTYGAFNALTTRTYTATVDGANLREVLIDGEREGLRALPVAFTVDNAYLIMDIHPDGVGRFTAYTQYAGLFRLNLATGEVNTLPGEPACFCGAGIRAGRFLRLALTDDLTGFNVRVYDLSGERDFTIPALPRSNYTQAGAILIAPDGTLAVYALSQIDDFGTPRQRVETVFMLVDLQAMTQRPLTVPLTDYVQPVHWSEDNSAIIFTSPQRNGTWKIDLNTGDFTRIARLTYIGTLSTTEITSVG